MIQEQEKRSCQTVQLQTEVSENKPEEQVTDEGMPESYIKQCLYFEEHISDLTLTERTIFDFYLVGKPTKEILQELNITENTLKFHNKNLYGKLGITSRKQIREYVNAIKKIKSDK